MYLLGVILLLSIIVLIWGTNSSHKVQKEFESIKPLEDVTVKINSPQCSCWRKAISGNRNGKLMTCYMDDKEKEFAKLCKESKDVDCWYEVSQFDKWDVQKIK